MSLVGLYHRSLQAPDASVISIASLACLGGYSGGRRTHNTKTQVCRGIDRNCNLVAGRRGRTGDSWLRTCESALNPDCVYCMMYLWIVPTRTSTTALCGRERAAVYTTANHGMAATSDPIVSRVPWCL